MLSKVQAHSRPSGNISDHFKHKQPPPPRLCLFLPRAIANPSDGLWEWRDFMGFTFK